MNSVGTVRRDGPLHVRIRGSSLDRANKVECILKRTHARCPGDQKKTEKHRRMCPPRHGQNLCNRTPHQSSTACLLACSTGARWVIRSLVHGGFRHPKKDQASERPSKVSVVAVGRTPLTSGHRPVWAGCFLTCGPPAPPSASASDKRYRPSTSVGGNGQCARGTLKAIEV